VTKLAQLARKQEIPGLGDDCFFSSSLKCILERLMPVRSALR